MAVKLTSEERFRMNCDCAEPYDGDDHVDSCFVSVVESIVARRIADALRDATTAIDVEPGPLAKNAIGGEYLIECAVRSYRKGLLELADSYATKDPA